MEELRNENLELRSAIKQLTIERAKLEDQLYRAFRKCLNEKKRKICELEQELQEIRGRTNGALRVQSSGPTEAKRKPPPIPILDNDDSGSDTSIDSNVDFQPNENINNDADELELEQLEKNRGLDTSAGMLSSINCF